MGRSFVTTNIIDPVKAPFTKRSFTHLNAAITETSSEIVKSSIGSYTTNDLLIMRGCIVTPNIPGTSSVTEGAIYYNGEVYQVDANASISSPSATLVWSIVTTYIAGDPATFTDGNTYNFHAIKKMQLTNAGTGTGLADYDGATVKIKYGRAIIPIGVWDMDTNATKVVSFTGTIFDGKNYVAKIKDIKAYIFRDGQPTTVNPQGVPLTSVLTADLTPQGGIEALETINGVGSAVTLARKPSGHFDSSDYNDSVTNRGYLIVEYGDL